jgi:hypothetical protein
MRDESPKNLEFNVGFNTYMFCYDGTKHLILALLFCELDIHTEHV